MREDDVGPQSADTIKLTFRKEGHVRPSAGPPFLNLTVKGHNCQVTDAAWGDL
jgi:hypothetical protein